MREKARIQRVIEHYDEEAEEEFKREVGDAIHDEITWAHIEPFLPRRGWILDAGGGIGFWSMRMAEMSECSVVLLDIAPRLLRAANRKIRGLPAGVGVQVLDADIRAIPHVRSSFDFVLCEGDAIGICGDPEKAVSELSRVLSPNGYLVAGVDSTIFRACRALSEGRSLDEVIEFLRVGRAPAEDHSPFDSKSFTPTEFALLLSKYRLEVVKISGKPLGFNSRMRDVFVSSIPIGKRQEILDSAAERAKLEDILRQMYREPYLAAIGSHLQVVARKIEGTVASASSNSS